MSKRTLKLRRSDRIPPISDEVDEPQSTEDTEVNDQQSENMNSNQNGNCSGNERASDSQDEVIGAGDDETTDDEGAVDTPPPPKEKEGSPTPASMSPVPPTSDGNSKSRGKKEKKEKETEKKPIEKETKEVQEIVDMQTNIAWKCPVKFRVRWKDSDETEDSWEKADKLFCQDLIDEFLEISGRVSEYQKILEMKKEQQLEMENMRLSSRKRFQIDYTEDSEDEEVSMAYGTSTRKAKPIRSFEYEEPIAKKKIPKKKVMGEFEVEKIVDSRVRGRFTEYKVRWLNYSSRHDSWLPESELNCSGLINRYNKELKEIELEEDYEVESIQHMRERNGKTEYKVRWKGWSSKYDSWLPENEMNCPAILKKFNDTLDKLEKISDWQVEKILGHRERKGETEYRIHWLGFDDDGDTWEPIENLQGCMDLVEKYNAKVAIKEKRGSTNGKNVKDYDDASASESDSSDDGDSHRRKKRKDDDDDYGAKSKKKNPSNAKSRKKSTKANAKGKAAKGRKKKAALDNEDAKDNPAGQATRPSGRRKTAVSYSNYFED